MSSHNLSFVVYAPMYARNSAGIYALYKLAQDLNALGYIAFVTIWGESNYYIKPIFNVPIIPHIIAKDFIDCQNMVVIYPEVTVGNPLNAKRIVRWVMNEPGHFGVGDEVFDESELIVSYKEQFDRSIKNKIDCHLELPVIDKTFVFDSSIEKTDITVYTGKNKNPDLLLVPHYDNLLTRTSPSRNELTQIIKRTKTLYSFDNTTAVIDEARLNGCNVILIPDGTLHSFNDDKFGDVGISWISDPKYWSSDEIAKHSIAKLQQMESNYEKQLNIFIEIAKQKWHL